MEATDADTLCDLIRSLSSFARDRLRTNSPLPAGKLISVSHLGQKRRAFVLQRYFCGKPRPPFNFFLLTVAFLLLPCPAAFLSQVVPSKSDGGGHLPSLPPSSVLAWGFGQKNAPPAPTPPPPCTSFNNAAKNCNNALTQRRRERPEPSPTTQKPDRGFRTGEETPAFGRGLAVDRWGECRPRPLHRWRRRRREPKTGLGETPLLSLPPTPAAVLASPPPPFQFLAPSAVSLFKRAVGRRRRPRRPLAWGGGGGGGGGGDRCQETSKKPGPVRMTATVASVSSSKK